jgi:starch-binding outer membrane protein, SusD/RagB family
MHRARICGLALVILMAPAACNTEVTNPGRFEDEFLSDRTASQALVNGAGRAMAQGLNWISYTAAAVTREIHPAGSTGSFGITTLWQNGELRADDPDLDTHWEQAQRARWVAEEAVRRIEAAGPPKPGELQTLVQYNNVLQLAYLYAAYANKILGENMCEAVIDGSAALPNITFFNRADSLFTKAIAVTGGTPATITAGQTAAYAGRAAVRAFVGKWTEAVADAGRVPVTFVYNLPYYNIGDDPQRNRIFYSSGNSRESGSAYRAHTQWSTWYYDYFQASKDPRVPIVQTSLMGDAAIECCGRVPFWPEAKYTSSAAPIRLSSGREMRLIEAEAKLRSNDITGAFTSINLARTNATAPALTAPTALADAWRLLKRERGIELWLEARRLGDFRRWKETNTPGALDPLEQPGSGSHLAKQDLCFPISQSERQTNPNFRS